LINPSAYELKQLLLLAKAAVAEADAALGRALDRLDRAHGVGDGSDLASLHRRYDADYYADRRDDDDETDHGDSNGHEQGLGGLHAAVDAALAEARAMAPAAPPVLFPMRTSVLRALLEKWDPDWPKGGEGAS
jgi:hypothetical protein